MKNILLFILILTLVMVHSSPVLGQEPGHPSEKGDKDRFQAVEGRPEIENPPDEAGRLKKPITAPKRPTQLMNQEETYPPPGVRKFLLIVLFVGIIAFYFVFIHPKRKDISAFLAKMAGSEKSNDGMAALPLEPDPGATHEISGEEMLEHLYNRAYEPSEAKEKFRNFNADAILHSSFKLASGGSTIEISGLYFMDDAFGESPAESAATIIKSANPDYDRVYVFSGSISPESLLNVLVKREKGGDVKSLNGRELYSIYHESDLIADRMEMLRFSPCIPSREQLDMMLKDANSSGHRAVFVFDDKNGCFLAGDGEYDEIRKFLEKVKATAIVIGKEAAIAAVKS